MSHILKLMVYEMHSYCTPLSPFVGWIIRYIVKFFIGEENTFGSGVVLKKTSGVDYGLPEYLRQRTFFRREIELTESFKSDQTDKSWHLEQKNKSFLDKSNIGLTSCTKRLSRSLRMQSLSQEWVKAVIL